MVRGISMNEHEEEKASPDVTAIPATLMRWEYLLIVYLIFACFLVWYISENLLVWEPEASMWGLPKPIAGVIMMSITWLIVNWVVFIVYNIVMKKRIREVSGK